MDRFAEALAADPDVARWLAPRRLPFIRVEADRAGQYCVLVPGRRRQQVSLLTGQVLRRCDGTIPAIELAGLVVADGHAADPGEVLDLLEELAKKRWISWALDIPLTPWPERYLRRSLDEIAEPPLRQAALQRLDALKRGRDQVAEADGDPDRLLVALEALDDLFSDLTKSAPSRNHGQAYGGRTLVYHDSRRELC